MSAPVNVRELIAAELDKATVADPHTIWQRVVEQIAAKDLRSALLQIGTGEVSRMMANERNAVLAEASSMVARAGRPAPKEHPVLGQVNRWEAAAEAYQHFLRSRIPTADGHKFMADCTRLDLEYAVKIRRDHAAAVLSNADKYERIGAAMKKHGCATVGELPVEVIREVAA